MGDLMLHYPAHLLGYLRFGAAPGLDGLAEDSDLIWGHHGVALAPLGMGHTLIEAEESETAPGPGPGELPRRGPVLNYKVNVVQPLAELRWQFGYRLGHQV